MATLRQKTSFGPGIYRGRPFDVARLQAFVDGTNKAIAAGIAIPLLKRHAPINANDKETLQFSKEEGAGWVTKLWLENNAIAWEAKDVPKEDAKQVKDGTVRYSSPEFRPVYTSEKSGVYSGPIIRHFAFTPKPGNPHQGAIETIALEEQCMQLSEEDFEGPIALAEGERSDESYSKSHTYEKHEDDSLPATGKGKSIDEEELLNEDEEWFEDEHGKKIKRKKPKPGENEGEKAVHEQERPKGFDDSQHAEGDELEPKKKKPQQVEGEMAEEEVTPTDATRSRADSETPLETKEPKNPDMPPKATDKSKLSAVIAGLAQKNIVLPSDFDFDNDAAIDILLASINSAIKAENEAESEKDTEEDEEPVTDAPMPFSEGDYVMAFTEEELKSLPEPIRKKLEGEAKARKDAEARAQQFEEEKKEQLNTSARDTAKQAITVARVPPVFKRALLARYDVEEGAIQFEEGEELPVFTAQEVCKMVETMMPPNLRFEEEDTEVPPPKGTDTQQFFEEGETQPGHVSAAKAEEIVNTNPAFQAHKKHQPLRTVADLVAGQTAGAKPLSMLR